jgi:hypothetical protein
MEKFLFRVPAASHLHTVQMKVASKLIFTFNSSFQSPVDLFPYVWPVQAHQGKRNVIKK